MKRVPLVFCLFLLSPLVVAADSVSWAGLPNWTPLPTNPYTTTSTGGITVGVSMPSGPVWTTHQCLVPTFITPCLAGAFAQGDPLLWTNYTTGPLTLAFSSPLISVFTQIQTIWYGPFSATLTAYNANGGVLGTTTISGSTAATYDGSAPFIGFTDPTGSIAKIAITATSAFPNSSYDGLFINQLNFQATPALIPEPATLLLFGTGLLAAGLLRKRAR